MGQVKLAWGSDDSDLWAHNYPADGRIIMDLHQQIDFTPKKWDNLPVINRFIDIEQETLNTEQN